MREIAKRFQGQPLVVLSGDGGFTGSISNLFGVKVIPHTFTIGADGVLQDEHIGDASLEGKLKKFLARAQELQGPQKTLQ